MRLTLHIGTEKTATTTIQHFLLHNQDQLKKHAIALSAVAGRGNNRRLAAYCQPRDGQDDFWAHHNLRTVDERDQFFDGFEADLAAEIAQAATWADHMVLSSEHFHSRLRDVAAIQRLHDVLAPHFSDIRVLCYVREQAATAQSLYSTAIKAGVAANFDRFMGQCTPASPRYNYLATGQSWASVFGHDAVEFRLFLRDKFKQGDICSDFLDAVDPALDPDGFARLDRDQNESLGAFGIQLGLINNQVNPRYRPDGSPNPVHLQVRTALQATDLAAQGVVSFAAAADIHAAFDACNRAFAAEFLKDPDGTGGNPFPPPKTHLAANATLSTDQLGTFWQAFLTQLQDAPILGQAEANRLRRTARKLKRGKPLDPDEITALNQIIDRVAPPPRKGGRS